MALTDAERLQMTGLALTKYSVHYKASTGGGLFLSKVGVEVNPLFVTYFAEEAIEEV